MKQVFMTILLLLSGLFASPQNTLSLKEFMSIVRRYHPVAKRAALGVEIAKTEVTSAKGAFDPRFENSIIRKEFDGLLYYDHQISEVRIPTWYGIDVVAGIESLSGNRTSTPDTKGNSSYLGFSIPVAKGLVMDSRRAILKQAKIFEQMSLQEQRGIVNDLLFDAIKAYWNWWQQVEVQRLFQKAALNAAQRFRLVKTAYEIGERPAIDTVEALAQLQSFQIGANEIELEVANSQLSLNIFLWQENEQPYVLPSSVLPQTVLPSLVENMQIEQFQELIKLHPELEGYRFKLKALQVEKQLKFQSLLPAVVLKYKQLNGSHNFQKLVNTPWLENNYRYGVAISFPLRLSEGRGEYRGAKLKIEQTKLQQLNKQISLQTKLRQYYNEWRQLRQQISLQEQAAHSYASLQRGEEIKFSNGESSLFMVNAREIKTLEAMQKLMELQSKEQQAAAGAIWASGLLDNY